MDAKGIVHGDIKLDNILLFDDDVVKLTDFGLSLLCTKERLVVYDLFPQAPEMFEKIVSHKSDMWAFGLLLYELATGEHLIRHEDAYGYVLMLKTLDTSKVTLGLTREYDEILFGCLEIKDYPPQNVYVCYHQTYNANRFRK